MSQTTCDLCRRALDTITLADSSSLPKTLNWYSETSQFVESCWLCNVIRDRVIGPALRGVRIQTQQSNNATNETSLPVTLEVSSINSNGNDRGLLWAFFDLFTVIPPLPFDCLLNFNIGFSMEGFAIDPGQTVLTAYSREPKLITANRSPPSPVLGLGTNKAAPHGGRRPDSLR